MIAELRLTLRSDFLDVHRTSRHSTVVYFMIQILAKSPSQSGQGGGLDIER